VNGASKERPSWFDLVLGEPLTIPLLGAGEAATDVEAGKVVSPIVEGFVACTGRYTFHGDPVVHNVELSLFPNWVGSDQERSVQLAGTG
jgi:hypothetical protein